MTPTAIIQARMSASRLPGKVLKEIAGRPMLSWAVERARRAACLSGVDSPVWVATTTDPADDPLAEYCTARGYPCFRGSQFDVLDRFYQAALAAGAEVVIRITADCPFIDPAVIDATYQAFQAAGADFAANRLPPPFQRTFPIGLDTEICTFAALERAWCETREPFHREHVMPYFYAGLLDNAPETLGRDEEQVFTVAPPSHPGAPFRVALNQVPDEIRRTHPGSGALRWTVDTPADLDLARAVAAAFPGRDDFGWQELLALFEKHPELAQINAAIAQKDVRVVDTRSQK